MGLKDDLETDVEKIYQAVWERRDGQIIPEDKDISLGNKGVDMDVTMLYADLSDSTKMVDSYPDWFAAENYKTFLQCATRIIKSEGGEIRSYDGDRVMGIFHGEYKNTRAVRCGLKINWAVKNIIQPLKKKQYSDNSYIMRHTVGIDTSKVLAIRAGIRGSNDISWIGSSANYAAKLSSLPPDYPTWITGSVYKAMEKTVKFSNGTNMWESMKWTDMNDLQIYRSSYWWSIS